MVSTVRGSGHLARVHKPLDDNKHVGVELEAKRIDTIEGGGSSASVSTTAGAGSRTALAGFSAAQKKKPMWRAAVSTALLGLALLGGLAPAAKAQAALSPRRQDTELVLPLTTGPPTDVIVTQAAHHGQHAKHPPPPEVDPRPHHGLPDTLATLTTGMAVTHGTDPGDFYCEHAFFTTTQVARAGHSSVLFNDHNEPLTGFLHNPSDAFTYDATQTPVQSARHAERAQVVGAAIRGYFEQARDQLGDKSPGSSHGSSPSKPFKMLLTGYGSWGSVVNNPTGDFVAHKENVDAAMQAAFGSALVTPAGKQDGTELRYRVVVDGKERTIVVNAVQLPVADDAINGSPSSLQAIMGKFKPHAVLSMGVAGGSATFLAEFHADNGGLAEKNGQIVHDDGKQADVNQPDNFALARAIQIGAATWQSPPQQVTPGPAMATVNP